MRRLITGLVLTSLLVIASAAPTFAAKPPTDTLWLDGQQVRTIVPPAASPQQGRDAFYRVPGTGGVAAVGPGDSGYHGGKWAVYDVTFTNDQIQLTSEAAILQAEKDGLVIVVRHAADDFKCPIQGR
jgi:hypothetical protein